MSPAVLLALELGLKYGMPLAVGIFEKWSKDEPDNATPKEWLDLLTSPSLTKSYDQYIRDARAKLNTTAPAV
jgi:hypothetical protein